MGEDDGDGVAFDFVGEDGFVFFRREFSGEFGASPGGLDDGGTQPLPWDHEERAAVGERAGEGVYLTHG